MTPPSYYHAIAGDSSLGTVGRPYRGPEGWRSSTEQRVEHDSHLAFAIRVAAPPAPIANPMPMSSPRPCLYNRRTRFQQPVHDRLSEAVTGEAVRHDHVDVVALLERPQARVQRPGHG